MSTTGEVLDQIDDAIRDWLVGPDAMRRNAPADVHAVQTDRDSPRSPWSAAQEVVPSNVLVQFGWSLAEVESSAQQMRLMEIVGWSFAGPELVFAPRPRREAPPPLAIAGHAYRRRVRNRRGR